MKISVEVTFTDLEGDYAPIPSVEVICPRCEHKATAYGQSDASIRKACTILRSECKKKERNFYEATK